MSPSVAEYVFFPDDESIVAAFKKKTNKLTTAPLDLTSDARPEGATTKVEIAEQMLASVINR